MIMHTSGTYIENIDFLIFFNFLLLTRSEAKLGIIMLVCPQGTFWTQIVVINHYGKYIIAILPKKEKDKNQHAENCRLIGDTLAGKLKDEKSAIIVDVKGNQIEAMQIAEGIALSNYTFTKHKTGGKANKLETIYLCKDSSKKNIKCWGD